MTINDISRIHAFLVGPKPIGSDAFFQILERIYVDCCTRGTLYWNRANVACIVMFVIMSMNKYYVINSPVLLDALNVLDASDEGEVMREPMVREPCQERINISFRSKTVARKAKARFHSLVRGTMATRREV